MRKIKNHMDSWDIWTSPNITSRCKERKCLKVDYCKTELFIFLHKNKLLWVTQISQEHRLCPSTLSFLSPACLLIFSFEI